ncbi:MAG: MBL fold metallo-hydrolase [Proteobacteria bacterium]|nr:MBL fold metallo-hydrolase [Pseudomonadota bacterium]
MIVTFHGGVREVTGSMHLVSANRDHILLDCGMFQGRRKESDMKNRTFSVDPKMITNMILSHAHIDHSGRIPLLTEGGFTGRILCTRTTADVCEYLLLDSAHIQESDAGYLNYKMIRNHLFTLQESGKRKLANKEKDTIKKQLKKEKHGLNLEAINELLDKYRLEKVMPLYTYEQATRAMTFFDGYPYRSPVTIGRGMTATFFEAGHILGSSMCMINFRENGKNYNVCYTGDIGRFNRPILRDPTLTFPKEFENIDLLIMESTYGDRHHGPVEDQKQRIKEIVTETVEKGGSVLIPAFAFGRTQDIIYILHELYNEGDIPKVPIYVDSPLASKLTKVFGEHPEVFDRDTHKTFLEQGINPFSFEQLHYTASVEESMEIMRDDKPHIVVSSSGMCEAGRILHHLRHKIHQSKNTIMIVGYMAQHTLGRRILELGIRENPGSSRSSKDAPEIKILGKSYPLHARVVKLDGFSAHADKNEITTFLKQSNLTIKNIAVVHGEEDQSLALQKYLNENGYKAIVPHVGETLSL